MARITRDQSCLPRWPTAYACCAILAACCILVTNVPRGIQAQGLRNDPASRARSGTSFSSFSQVYRSSSAFQSAMRTAKNKRTACSSGRGSLCGSGGSASEQAALQLATAPQAFDARSSFVNLRVLGPVKNQDTCGICVAFAVLGAAQTAASVALKVSFGDNSMSEQDFFFCRTEDRKVLRDCGGGWTLEKGMLAFIESQDGGQLPVTEACLPFTPDINVGGAAACKRTCTTKLQQLVQGQYRSRPLGNIWDMQRHIREQGSIVCRMQLFSDIRPFFADMPLGLYKGPGPNATQEEAHAVQVVGYDNNRQAWLIKNSWGPEFADKGYAWIGFDAPSMCDPQDTYGFVFEPYLPPAAALAKLTPAPGRKGCYTYRAVAGDYPDKLALRFGIRVQQLLLDNLDAITDPSTVPVDATLLLCSVNAGAVPGVVVAQGNASAARTQGATTTSISGSNEEVRVLMAIKRVLDPCGCSLTDWKLDSASPCGWNGIVCDGSGRVVKLYNWDDKYDTVSLELDGQLPSGDLLARLPALTELRFTFAKGLGGPLPEDWSQLKQLKSIQLNGNKLTGTLPASWSAMTSLTVLTVHQNFLKGPLPPSWSKLTNLTNLYLSRNSYSGTLPPSWGALSKLRILYLCCSGLSGPLPAAWAGMTALEDLDVSLNALTGPLPPSWGAMSKLKVCNLYVNRLSGGLPKAWSGMAGLQTLSLYSNQLTGSVPPSWDSWRRLTLAVLFDNQGLTGCLPPAWRSTVNVGRRVEGSGPHEGGDLLSAGTNITGFC